MKVLVVDDSRLIRNIVKNILGERRIKDEAILEAADGQEALTTLLREKIDLLLVDWNMPRLDGLELIKKLRSSEQYARLPIVMITSEAARYNVVQAIKAGVSDYVVKPVTAKAVLEKLDKYLVELEK